jgi:DNA-binding cell septation regulator SpoVG
MTVTKIVTNSISPQESGVCGEFTVTLDDALCIHKILVVNGEKGLFITFPNTGEMKRFTKAKRYADIVHPTNNSLRQYIQTQVLEWYNKEIENLN